MRTCDAAAVTLTLASWALAPAAAQTCDPYFADFGRSPYHFLRGGAVVWDDGTGPTLYHGFTDEGVLVRWSGSEWRPFSLAGVPPGFVDFAPWILDRGAGDELHLYVRIDDADLLLRWNGGEWVPSGLCFGNQCPGYQVVGGLMQSVDLGDGPRIYAIGHRPGNGDTLVVRWDETHWTDIGQATDRSIDALVRYDDGTGPSLFVIGDFTMFSGVPGQGMVRWNGASWIPATPLQNRVLGGGVAIAGDLGDGPAIYTTARVIINGASQVGVNKWDGQRWSHLGHPESPQPPNGPLRTDSLGVFDDGRGRALYVGGYFLTFSGVTSGDLVRYRPGMGFEAVGGGISGGVTEMLVYQDVRGRALYLASPFLGEAGGGRTNQRRVMWVGCPNCYANCDLSTAPPALNVGDLVCFLQKFAARDPYANCDHSTTPPMINVDDFMCFAQKIAAGCP